jgi:hypothetical protein
MKPEAASRDMAVQTKNFKRTSKAKSKKIFFLLLTEKCKNNNPKESYQK